MKCLRVSSLCKIIISHLEMMDSLKNSMNASGMKSKSRFWDSIHKAFLNQELSSCRKKAEIKMLEKKTKARDTLKTGGWYHCLIQIWKL